MGSLMSSGGSSLICRCISKASMVELVPASTVWFEKNSHLTANPIARIAKTASTWRECMTVSPSAPRVLIDLPITRAAATTRTGEQKQALVGEHDRSVPYGRKNPRWTDGGKVHSRARTRSRRNDPRRYSDSAAPGRELVLTRLRPVGPKALVLSVRS